MKIRITELLFITAIFAFAIACLEQSQPRSQFLFGNFAYLVLLVAIPMAIGRTQRARAFWIGFVVTGMLYIGFSLLPDADGNSPRLIGNELTTYVSREAFWKLEELSGDGTDDPFAAINDNVSGLSLIRSSGQRILEDNKVEEVKAEIEDTSQPTVNVAGGGFGGGGDRPPGFSDGVTEADFQSLIDLIEETRGDDSWTDTGTGVGTILPFPANITCMIAKPESRSLECFVATAHSVWALLLGWIVGHASGFVYESREATNS